MPIKLGKRHAAHISAPGILQGCGPERTQTHSTSSTSLPAFCLGPRSQKGYREVEPQKKKWPCTVRRRDKSLGCQGHEVGVQGLAEDGAAQKSAGRSSVVWSQMCSRSWAPRGLEESSRAGAERTEMTGATQRKTTGSSSCSVETDPVLGTLGTGWDTGRPPSL